MPKFSVVIPAFNGERHVEQCVRSVLAQTYRDLEVILVDDGSTDRTSELFEAFAQDDQRVTVVRRRNGGLSRARNTGLDHAAGEYVVFLDADDYWDDVDALAGLAAIADAHGPDLIVWGCKRLFERKGQVEVPPPLGTDLPAEKAELLDVLMRAGRYGPAAWAKAIRRELFAAHDLAFEPDVHSEDLEWSARLARFAGPIVHYDNPFYVNRQINGSRSKSFAEQDAHDEGLRAALLAFAAERYVELLITQVRSARTQAHLPGLRHHADVLASGVTPGVRAAL